MGIKNETFNKIKNLEPLTLEDKKEMLVDTQRAGFDPSIHQVRASIDLMDAIERFNKQSSEQTDKVINLTRVIVILTIIMILGLGVQIGLAIKQTDYTEIQSRADRIFQARAIQDAVNLCKNSPELQESGLYNPSNGKPASCSEVLEDFQK